MFGEVLPNLLRELQQGNNYGEYSYKIFSLCFRGIDHMVVSIFRYFSIFMVEWAGALAIYRNSLSLRTSYAGG